MRISQRIVDQDSRFVASAQFGSAGVKDGVAGRQVCADLNIAGCRGAAADGGQADGLQVCAVNDIVVDIHGIAQIVFVRFHVIAVADFDDRSVRRTVIRQQRPPLQIISARIDQITVIVFCKRTGTGIAPHIVGTGVCGFVHDKKALTRNSHIRRI